MKIEMETEPSLEKKFIVEATGSNALADGTAITWQGGYGLDDSDETGEDHVPTVSIVCDACDDAIDTKQPWWHNDSRNIDFCTDCMPEDQTSIRPAFLDDDLKCDLCGNSADLLLGSHKEINYRRIIPSKLNPENRDGAENKQLLPMKLGFGGMIRLEDHCWDCQDVFLS